MVIGMPRSKWDEEDDCCVNCCNWAASKSMVVVVPGIPRAEEVVKVCK